MADTKTPLFLSTLKAIAAVRHRLGLSLDRALMDRQAAVLASAAASLAEGAVFGAVEQALEETPEDVEAAVRRLNELATKRRVHLHPSPPKAASLAERMAVRSRGWKARAQRALIQFAMGGVVGVLLFFDLPIIALEPGGMSALSPAAHGLEQFLATLETGSTSRELRMPALGLLNSGLLWLQGMDADTRRGQFSPRSAVRDSTNVPSHRILSRLYTPDSRGFSFVDVVPMVPTAVGTTTVATAVETWLVAVERVEVMRLKSCPAQQRWVGRYEPAKRSKIFLCPQQGRDALATLLHEAAHHLQWKNPRPAPRIVELEADGIAASVLHAVGVPVPASQFSYIAKAPDAGSVLRSRRQQIEARAAVLLDVVAAAAGRP